MGSYIMSDKSAYPVAAGAVITHRDQVSINANGYAVAAPAPADGAPGTVVGSSIDDVDNTAGADGDLSVTVEHSLGGRKAFLLTGSGLTTAAIGKPVYVGANPKTVTTTSADAVLSGTLQGIEADGRARVVFAL